MDMVKIRQWFGVKCGCWGGGGGTVVKFWKHFALPINTASRSVSERPTAYCLLCMPQTYQISRCFTRITAVLTFRLLTSTIVDVPHS